MQTMARKVGEIQEHVMPGELGKCVREEKHGQRCYMPLRGKDWHAHWFLPQGAYCWLWQVTWWEGEARLEGLKREEKWGSREDPLEIKLTVLISLLQYFQPPGLASWVYFFQGFLKVQEDIYVHRSLWLSLSEEELISVNNVINLLCQAKTEDLSLYLIFFLWPFLI